MRGTALVGNLHKLVDWNLSAGLCVVGQRIRKVRQVVRHLLAQWNCYRLTGGRSRQCSFQEEHGKQQPHGYQEEFHASRSLRWKYARRRITRPSVTECSLKTNWQHTFESIYTEFSRAYKELMTSDLNGWRMYDILKREAVLMSVLSASNNGWGKKRRYLSSGS